MYTISAGRFRMHTYLYIIIYSTTYTLVQNTHFLLLTQQCRRLQYTYDILNIYFKIVQAYINHHSNEYAKLCPITSAVVQPAHVFLTCILSAIEQNCRKYSDFCRVLFGLRNDEISV